MSAEPTSSASWPEQRARSLPDLRAARQNEQGFESTGRQIPGY
jgi:hypothetical protein